MQNKNRIEVGKIFALTKRINDNLHFNFSLKNLNHRMIFTACALVAEQFGADLRAMKGKPYPIVKNAILHYLTQEIQNVKVQNKLHILLDTFNSIRLGIETNGDALGDFLDCVADISENINSDFWNGEDVMAIFFHEFNRYKGKSEIGQVFTPDHITSFMYHLLDVNQNDIVLDAACGSGSFLVKAMCNMISEAGGVNTAKAKEIKQNQLFGIEIDREIFAHACANMLIHKDGKTNLEQLDSRTSTASDWIKSKNPTKILMNPPFEQKYGCVKIVENVLDSVAPGTKCAFIMPDKKLEKVKPAKKLLNRHRLEKIIKLPENTFDEGVTTSIFVFEAGVPQKKREIFACYFSDDGLETVKNGGRQDIRGAWKNFERQWLEVVRKQVGDTVQWLNPAEHLSWQAPQKKFEICEEDFAKTVMDYLMFERKIDQKKFKENILQNTLYSNFNVDFEAQK